MGVAVTPTSANGAWGMGNRARPESRSICFFRREVGRHQGGQGRLSLSACCPLGVARMPGLAQLREQFGVNAPFLARWAVWLKDGPLAEGSSTIAVEVQQVELGPWFVGGFASSSQSKGLQAGRRR